jgi:phosphoribosylamine--glycine ligase
MGVFTPLPFVDEAQERRITEQIIGPTLRALQARGIDFRGVLYSNIMLTERGPMVLEHNTRFGDPETQALMLLMSADVLDVLAFAEDGQTSIKPEKLWHEGYAMSLTLASGGYPGKYATGIPIVGIEEARRIEGVQVFHAGTAMKDGRLVTAGGRVLSVAARGMTLQEAKERVYEAAGHIRFEGMHYRKDIGWRGLQKIDKRKFLENEE